MFVLCLLCVGDYSSLVKIFHLIPTIHLRSTSHSQFKVENTKAQGIKEFDQGYQDNALKQIIFCFCC